jgi:pre-60S factor REI1
MRSDWHRYNLKRRVTSLPPIASEVFTEKVLQAQASSTAAASRAAYENTCTVCNRTYFSENAYQNHLGSQKHKAKLAEAGEKPIDDEVDSVMSSTFSLGDPINEKGEEIDSEAEEEFNEVVEGIKKTNLKDAPAATRRPGRPHHSAVSHLAENVTFMSDICLLKSQGPEDHEGGSTTASSITANGDIPLAQSLKRCLFCNYDSPSVELSAAHMERIHGMFIPEKPYLVDLEGLVGSLQEKIYEFQECLYCGKLKPNVFGLQTHMRDKGHCKIPFHTEDEQLEIGEFYDFTSTYSDVDEESDSEDNVPGKSNSGGVKLGVKRHAKTTDHDGGENMEVEDGWETDSSESSLDSADLTAVPLDERTHQYEKLDQHPHHTHTDPRPHHNKDGWHSHAHKHNHAVFYSDYELHLPSGRTAGHRSLNKYFRQNLHSHPSPAERQVQLAIEAARGSDSEDEADERVARRNERERGRALASRANGGLGMVGVSSEKRKEVALAEKRSRKIEERERRKFQWGNNKQSNSQKHFRVSLHGSKSSHQLLINSRILCCSDFLKSGLFMLSRMVASLFFNRSQSG